MDDMRRGLDIEKAEAALKRAAYKALHGTREERSGRFLTKQQAGPAKPKPALTRNASKTGQK
jgi:hypothetical protein